MSLQRATRATESATPALSAVVPAAPGDAEIAHRREAVLRRMLATPHIPHEALRASQSKKQDAR